MMLAPATAAMPAADPLSQAVTAADIAPGFDEILSGLAPAPPIFVAVELPNAAPDCCSIDGLASDAETSPWGDDSDDLNSPEPAPVAAAIATISPAVVPASSGWIGAPEVPPARAPDCDGRAPTDGRVTAVPRMALPGTWLVPLPVVVDPPAPAHGTADAAPDQIAALLPPQGVASAVIPTDAVQTPKSETDPAAVSAVAGLPAVAARLTVKPERTGNAAATDTRLVNTQQPPAPRTSASTSFGDLPFEAAGQGVIRTPAASPPRAAEASASPIGPALPGPQTSPGPTTAALPTPPVAPSDGTATAAQPAPPSAVVPRLAPTLPAPPVTAVAILPEGRAAGALLAGPVRTGAVRAPRPAPPAGADPDPVMAPVAGVVSAPSAAAPTDAATGLRPALPRVPQEPPMPVTGHVHDRGTGSLDLTTERLGAISVALAARDTRIGVHFTVDTAVAAGLLGSGAPRLAEGLAGGGGRMDGLSVDVRSGGSGSDGENRQTPRGEPVRVPPLPQPRRPGRTAATGRFA